MARVGRACGGAQGTRAGGKALTMCKQSSFGTSLLLFAWGREVWGEGGGQCGRIQPWCSLRLGACQMWGAGLLRGAVLEKWSDTSRRMTGLTSGEAPTGSVKNLPSWPWGHCPAVLLGSPSPSSRHLLRWHRTGSCTRNCPQHGARPCRAAPQCLCLCTLCDRHAQEIFQC